MTYKTHVLGALLATVAVNSAQSLPLFELPQIIAVGVASIPSLIPDIDHPKSYISNKFIPFKIFAIFVKHRTITHSFLFFAAMSAISYYFIPDHALYVSIGIASHIALDFLTPRGVPLFYPLNRRYYRLPFFRIKTNSWLESLFAIGLIIGIWVILTN